MISLLMPVMTRRTRDCMGELSPFQQLSRDRDPLGAFSEFPLKEASTTPGFLHPMHIYLAMRACQFLDEATRDRVLV